MVERIVHIDDVRGSNPLSPTISLKTYLKFAIQIGPNIPRGVAAIALAIVAMGV